MSLAVFFVPYAYKSLRLDHYSITKIMPLLLFLWFATSAIWFLLPNAFSTSLKRWSQGRQRLFLDINLLFTGIALTLYWTFLSCIVGMLVGGLTVRAVGFFTIAVCALIAVTFGVNFFKFFVDPASAFPASTPEIDLPNFSETGPGKLPEQVSDREIESAKDPGPLRKWLLALTVVLLFAGGIGLIFFRWLPSPAVLAFAESSWWPVVLLMFFTSIFALYGQTLPELSRRSRSPAHANAKIIAVLSLLAVATTHSLLTQFVPRMTSLIEPLQPVSVEFVIVKKYGEAKGCGYSARIAYSHIPERTTRICGLQPAVWKKLVPGDRLLVSGEGNRWGMIPKHVGIMR